MKMRFSELITSLQSVRRLNDLDPEVTAITYDSRQAEPGTLFVCVPGLKTDGHLYLPDAIARGAVAGVVENAPPVPNSATALCQVPDARVALARLAAVWNGHPSRRLRLFGVTGTNGKTTTTYLLESIFRKAGMRAGVIGTLGCRIDGQAVPTTRTTPESLDLQILLARMVASEVNAVAIEVSSEGLAMKRLLGCRFAGAVFTNLTQDHLNFHRTMDAYFEAKAGLFTDYDRAPCYCASINLDDPGGRRLAERLACDGEASRVLGFGAGPSAAVRAEDVQMSSLGTRFRLRTPAGECSVVLRLTGAFNVANSLAAASAAVGAGIPLEAVVAGLEAVEGVPGRFERVDAGQEFTVIVDYAHSPDGLDNVLRAARALQPRRLWCVFGCGGDRDPDKRPQMGRIAAELADQVVVTSDNPRSEDPDAIIAAVAAGIPAGVPALTEPDRALAIRLAIDAAEPGDLVVIAGKGHETYQIFKDRTIHFDDREAAREALSARLVS